jgi:hypothetical protein
MSRSYSSSTPKRLRGVWWDSFSFIGSDLTTHHTVSTSGLDGNCQLHALSTSTPSKHERSILVLSDVLTSVFTVRFQVLTAVSMKVTAVWPCSLMEARRHFRDAYCLHYQGEES